MDVIIKGLGVSVTPTDVIITMAVLFLILTALDYYDRHIK